jgi:hypothetical protein
MSFFKVLALILFETLIMVVVVFANDLFVAQTVRLANLLNTYTYSLDQVLNLAVIVPLWGLIPVAIAYLLNKKILYIAPKVFWWVQALFVLGFVTPLVLFILNK